MSDTDRDDSGVGRRTFLRATGGAAAAAALAGCSGENIETTTTSSGTEAGGTSGATETDAEATESSDGGSEDFAVTITQGQMPTTLDPHDHRDIPTDIVMLQAYEGLLRRNRNGKIQASLAKDWERKEDGRVRFHIREGPTFHSGNDLTPEDVAFSINRITKKDVGIQSPQSGQLAGVTGAAVVDGQRAVDVMSDGLNPIVFAEFAIYCDVMEKAWVQEHEPTYIAKNMNGTGPFRQTGYQQNVRVAFERNEDYWQEPAAVTELTVNAAKEASVRVNRLIEGETDITVNVPPQSVSRVQNAETADIDAVGSTRILYNAMRYDVEPFSSPKFRRAMNHAVDLEAIVKNVLGSFGAQTSQPTLEGFFGYDGELGTYPHDPERAEKLVEESGHAGAEIQLHTPVGRYLKDVQIAQAVSNMINDLPNVSCSVKQRDFGTLAGELTDGNLESSPKFYLIGWGNATFDAAQTIEPTLTSDGVLTSYKSEKLDSLMSKAGKTTGEERDELLQQANTHCHDQAPWIFLNRQYSVYGSAARVQWKARRDERIDAYAIEPAQ
jgi:peptide/nickel transport system substrate-binding protein